MPSEPNPPLPATLDALRAAHQAGARFEYLMFWGHTAPRSGEIGPHVLSQWWPAPFVADGVRYASAEHFMMAGKARLFGDPDALERILGCDDPARAKALGRKVRGFDEARWQAHRFELVVAGSIAKFTASDALRAFLLGTGDKLLVEASPRDRVWGIGLSKTDPRAQDPMLWRGQNLLGFALNAARAQLRHEAQRRRA